MKGLGFYICVGVIVAVTAAGADEPEWYITTVDDGRRVGMMCSLALDAADNPRISYYDLYNRNLKYAYYDGTSWHIEVVDPELNTGQYTGLALDSKGRPHISYAYYRDFDHAELRYAYFDGTEWRITTVDRAGGMHTAMALDSQDRPHISYGEWISASESNLRYAYYDGSSWHAEVVDAGARPGYCTSIALDSRDRPHISYRDDGPHCWLKYAYYDGGGWHVTTVDKSLNATGMGTSIAVDASGRPHISYQEDLSEALKYAYFDGSRWHITIVDDDDVNHGTSIALDGGDRVHISYDASWGTGGPHYTSELRYAYKDGFEWHTEVIESGGEDEALGGWNSLALDSGDLPHVAYVADAENSTYDSLKYARALGSYLDYFNATPKGYDALGLRWSVKAPLAGRITGYNLYRREKGEEEWSKITDTPLPGGGSGSYDDAGLACLRCYEYRLEGLMKERGVVQFGITEGTTTAPQAFFLHNARPNPWSSKAVIAFELMDRADVELSVYDLSGRKVATLAAGWLPPGAHEREVSALAPGVYIYRLQAGEWAGAKKMVVVR